MAEPTAKPAVAPKQANKRGTARLAAVQALYQMDVAQTDIAEVIGAFEAFWMGKEVEGDTYLPADSQFFRDLVQGVMREQGRIDVAIDRLLADGWPLKRIEAVLRAVLRAGAFELFERPDIPARVIIKEYLDVADAFVDRDEVGMVNAVLDAVARRVRPDEVAKGA
ncbi:MAG: transcription antitermination factor NusB [Alphaproteobacteria bacterium]